MVLVFFAAYMMLMIILPLLYPYGSFSGLDGRPGVMDNWDRLAFADPLTRAVYAFGDIFCHQETARSFMINGSQLAFCQRDVSILIGVILGLIITDEAIGRFYTGDKRFLYAGAVMLTTTLVEWGIEYISGMDILAARIVTGILSGIGVALLLQYGVTRQYEKVFDIAGREVDR
jgi:uncharacterized membrane protein